MLYENAKVFESNYPDWIDKLKETSVDSRYQTTETKSGDITLSVEKENKVFLFHSRYYPNREATKLLESAVEKEPEVLVLG